MMISPLGIAGFTEILTPPLTLPTTVDQLHDTNDGVAWLAEFEPLLQQPVLQPLAMSFGPGLGPLGIAGFAEHGTINLYQPSPATTERHLTVATAAGSMLSGSTAVQVENRLRTDRIRIARELPRTMERISGFVSETSAEVVLDGADGALDYLFTDRVLVGRPFRLKLAATKRRSDGMEVAPDLSQFQVAFEGRIKDAEITPEGDVFLRLSDGFERLDRPVQASLYTGTGGREGTPDLEGKPIPLAYGEIEGAEPTCVDPNIGMFQVHHGEFRGLQVKDRGVPLVFANRDTKTYEALASLTVEGEVDADTADIPSGFYATCRAEGYFRVAAYGGPLTCDIQGDGLYDGPVKFRNGVTFRNGVGFRTPGARTHRKRAGGLFYRILTTRAGFKPEELDLDRLLQFDLSFPFNQGRYISSNERPTVREVCTEIVDSVGAVVLRNRFGQILLRELSAPGAASFVQIRDNTLTKRVERVALPWGSPWSDIQLTYGRNERPLLDGEVSVDLDDATKDALKRSVRNVEVSDAKLRPLIPDKEPLVIPTRLRFAKDALAVASRLLGYYGARWSMYRVTADNIAFRTDLTSTVDVAVSRFGLDKGQMFAVIGSDEQPSNIETELLLL